MTVQIVIGGLLSVVSGAGRGAVWTEERGTSDEGRRHRQAPRGGSGAAWRRRGRAAMSTPGDAAATIRSKRYLALLVLAAAIGVPISALAYFFLYLVSRLQHWLFTSLPHGLGFHGEPVWWPVPLLAVAGLLVAAAIRYLPGRGGHSPADGFHAGGAPSPSA